ncbi:uncharacterized protein LOC132305356 [Cornus florida]|uniref:uncharacterized protein LOC132305356 n=1 Tax=Cornus florida TaxID=4283 RepID=UPI0028A19F23|nr:uncharacterized protein LOC132305356 [Cornus florida]
MKQVYNKVVFAVDEIDVSYRIHLCRLCKAVQHSKSIGDLLMTYCGGNGLELDGKSDPKSQPRPLETNGNERETRSNKLKKTRKADETDNSLEINRNDGASTHKAKAHRRDDVGQLVKMNSDVKASKKNQTGPIKVEHNETEIANNAAGKRKRDSKKNIVEKQSKGSSNQISLPLGIELTNVANIDMPAEDIGDALQFLEFCEAFGQALHLNKGQPESLLRDLAGFSILNTTFCRCPSKTGVGNSWLQHLSKFISESQCPSKELLLDSWNVDANGYEELNSSRRLRLLNFLCDEALGTTVKSWIDEKNSEFVEEEKKKALAEKQTEKNMKKRLQDEVARAILLKKGAPLSISENDNLISKIKAEVAQTLAETLEATTIGMKKINNYEGKCRRRVGCKAGIGGLLLEAVASVEQQRWG